MHPIRRLAMLVAMLLALPIAARADSALDLVSRLYASIVDDSRFAGFVPSATPDERRKIMTERLAAVLDANDAATEEPCIDFAPELDAQDYDSAEIGATLRLTEAPTAAGGQTVTATFSIFGEPRTVVWSFVPVNGKLLLDDISGEGWNLADTVCVPPG
jgi:hypothetical protein